MIETKVSQFRYQYAAKFICTANIPGTSQTTSSFLPGVYQTAVNIHNPSEESVKLRRKVAIVGSLQTPEFIEDTLKPDRVVSVDCSSDLGIGPTIHGFEGFLVVESTDSLDVVAVYTAGKLDGEVESIDVEQVKERKLG